MYTPKKKKDREAEEIFFSKGGGRGTPDINIPIFIVLQIRTGIATEKNIV